MTGDDAETVKAEREGLENAISGVHMTTSMGYTKTYMHTSKNVTQANKNSIHTHTRTHIQEEGKGCVCVCGVGVAKKLTQKHHFCLPYGMRSCFFFLICIIKKNQTKKKNIKSVVSLSAQSTFLHRIHISSRGTKFGMTTHTISLCGTWRPSRFLFFFKRLQIGNPQAPPSYLRGCFFLLIASPRWGMEKKQIKNCVLFCVNICCYEKKKRVLSFFHKLFDDKAWPFLHWSADEKFVCRSVRTEVHLFDCAQHLMVAPAAAAVDGGGGGGGGDEPGDEDQKQGEQRRTYVQPSSRISGLKQLRFL